MSGNGSDQSGRGGGPQEPGGYRPPPLPWEQQSAGAQGEAGAAAAASHPSAPPYGADGPPQGAAPGRAVPSPQGWASRHAGQGGPRDPWAAPTYGAPHGPVTPGGAPQGPPTYDAPQSYAPPQQPYPAGSPQAYGSPQGHGAPAQPQPYAAPQGYGPPPSQGRGFPAWAGWLIGVGAVIVVAAVVIVALVINMLPGDDTASAGGSDAGQGEGSAPAGSVDFPLTEAGPSGIDHLWNTDGVSDPGWSFTGDGEYFEANKDGQTCVLFGYSTGAYGVSGASDDATASANDFGGYLDVLMGGDESIASHRFEPSGTAAVPTPAGSVEFQVYDVQIEWEDADMSVTNERWLWRTFVDAGVAMQAYVSCGLDDIEAEAASLAELTVD